jgi:aerobic-type carbon monoxide dehydrogenase small subunit (CoxS/CutS family)
MDTSTKPTAVAISRIALTVNGQPRQLKLDPRTSLLDALSEHLHLTGTKKGCDHGQCGACTVLINGRRINSCLTLAVMHDDDDIVTIEGLSAPEALHPLQAAFIERDAFQCGYCTPGEAVVDPRSGAFVNCDLAGYLVPVHADIPVIDAVILDGFDDKANVLDVKGLGELGICGAGAAVGNAVFNVTGVRVRDFPITLDKLLPALPQQV